MLFSFERDQFENLSKSTTDPFGNPSMESSQPSSSRAQGKENLYSPSTSTVVDSSLKDLLNTLTKRIETLESKLNKQKVITGFLSRNPFM